jgi:hypothetical protein
MNGYMNEKAPVTLRRGRRLWMRRSSCSEAASSDSHTSHVIVAAAFTSARRLRSRFLRPAVRYWARRRRRLCALPI